MARPSGVTRNRPPELVPGKAKRPGEEMEQEVADLLRMRGFTVVPDLRTDGFRCDLIVSRGQAPFSESYVVEVKDHERPIGNEDILKLGGAIVATQRTYPGIGGLLVSRNGFTADARKAADSQNIRLATLDDLLNGLIDFTSYIRAYANDYAQSTISHLFVDPAYGIGHPTAPEEAESLVTGLLHWVRDTSSPKNILLLGEYGLGKTVAVEQFTYKIIAAILNGESSLPIPIVIHLKHFAKALYDLRYLITSHLVNELNVEGRYTTFVRLLRRGRILLILDGFDEMAMVVDENTRDHNFLLLQSLCVGDARVIVTGRPEYFPSEKHLSDLISEQRHHNPAVQATLPDTYNLPDFHKLYVQPFDSERISTFLKLYGSLSDGSDGYSADAVALQISRTYDLRSLAARPVLLDLIVKTLPRLSFHTQPITAATLYDQYTRFWLDREELKGRQLIPRDVKEAFVHELAWRMITKAQYTIHYSDLPLEIIDFFDPRSEKDWNAHDHDIRACSYLHRDESGNFSFAHKTFMEYFCASRISRELRLGRSNPFNEVRIPSEILSFFSSLGDEAALETLGDLIYTYSHSPKFRDNLLRFLSRVTLGESIGLYMRCMACFGGNEPTMIDRQLRQRIGKLTKHERQDLLVTVFSLKLGSSLKGIDKITKRLLSALKVDEFLVGEYAEHLSSGNNQFAFLGDRISNLEQIRRAVAALGGFERLAQHFQTPDIEFPDEETMKMWTKKTNASVRLYRELLKRYEVSPEDGHKFLENLRLRSHVQAKVDDVLRSRNVEVLTRELRLSTAATEEILSKSRLDWTEIRLLFRELKLRRNESYLHDLRRSSGLDSETFRSAFSLFAAAAKQAGLLR